jgi:hypothetical protein
MADQCESRIRNANVAEMETASSTTETSVRSGYLVGASRTSWNDMELSLLGKNLAFP